MEGAPVQGRVTEQEAEASIMPVRETRIKARTNRKARVMTAPFWLDSVSRKYHRT
jgi:hypothetical protein